MRDLAFLGFITISVFLVYAAAFARGYQRGTEDAEAAKNPLRSHEDSTG